MSRQAADVDVEPQDADLGHREVVVVGLGQHGSVGVRAGQQALQRAVAGALLFDDGLELDIAAQSHARSPQRPYGAGHRDQAGLHVARAAAVEPVAVAPRVERVTGPQGRARRRDHVNVAVEDERTAGRVGSGFAGPCRDHVALALDGPRERRVMRIGADGVGVHRDIDRLEAAVGERPRHDRLAGLLVAEHGRCGHELGEQVLHPGCLGGDRAVDPPERHRTEPSRI